MTVTFGRIGRVFLIAAGAFAVAAVVALVVVGGPVVPSILGGLALMGLIQGTVWTAVQHRMFGSVAAVRRAAAQPRTTATVVAVHGTSSAIGADAIARLDLLIDGKQVTRHVRVPFTHAALLRAGLELPVRTDPAGSRAMIVEWNRLR